MTRCLHCSRPAKSLLYDTLTALDGRCVRCWYAENDAWREGQRATSLHSVAPLAPEVDETHQNANPPTIARPRASLEVAP